MKRITKLSSLFDLRNRQPHRQARRAGQTTNTQATFPHSQTNAIHRNAIPNTHPYLPLETPGATRIVLLAPGPKDSPIRCLLVQVDLNSASALPYEALSYEWGQPSDDDPIIYLDDHPVRIRANLFHALQHIRRETSLGEDQALWIDSLSIDQSNLSERGHQVQMMCAIYKQASAVIIWLGPACDNSDTAMQLFADPNPPSVTPEQRTAIEALCRRSYWRRVWIQQEVNLARSYTIHCGAKSVTEAAFDNNIFAFQRQQVKTIPARDIITRREYRSTRINNLRMWINFANVRGLKTSDPHDYVYGMLGISTDCQHGEIMPDYEKPLVDLFFEVLAFCHTSNDYPGFPKALAENLGLVEDERVRAVIERDESRSRR